MEQKTDRQPKKRAWAQIHLSTAVVMLIASGVMMYVNRISRLYTEKYRESGTSSGWPLTYEIAVGPTLSTSPYPGLKAEQYIQLVELFVDILVSILIVLFIGIVFQKVYLVFARRP